MLKQRVITAIILVLATFWALFYASDMAWKIAILIVAFIAAWEWSGFAKIDIPVLRMIYAFAVVISANFAVDMLNTQNMFFLTLALAIIMLSVVHRYQFSQGQTGIKSDAFIMATGALAVILFAVTLVKFRNEFGAEYLLFSMALVWAIDTGAYFSGRRFGKHKLAVHVSPGKTWEGVFGGVLLTFIFAVIVLNLLLPELSYSMYAFAVVLSLIAAFSVYGDLFESVLKRQVDLKDSGRILPGHGGVLDRIDSLIIAAPMLYLAWYLATNS